MNRKVKVSDFLHRKKDPVRLEPTAEYRLVTVKLHHKGVVLRERKLGSLIGSNMYRVSEGQFILSGIDARNGAFGVVPADLDGAIVTNDFWCFDFDETVVKRDFFYWLTSTPLFLDACIKSSQGETQRIRLQKELFFNFEFLIPPIQEQEAFLKRISKADTAISSLQSELNSQSELFSRLRQTILQEAIEGKLTAKWREEHPVRKGDPEYDAAALLVKIKAEKQKLIAEGKIKKEKPLPPIKTDEMPFQIPKGWVWCRLGDLCRSVSDGDHQPPPKSKNGIHFLVISNVSKGHLDFSNTRFVSLEYYESLKDEKRPSDGDLLYTVTGSYGITILLNNPKSFCVQRHIGIIKPIKCIAGGYLEKILRSPFCLSQADKAAWGVAQKTVSLSSLRNFVISVPALKEQKAIVERVDRLLAMVSDLEAQVSDRKAKSDDLMQAVLREAFDGNTHQPRIHTDEHR